MVERPLSDALDAPETPRVRLRPVTEADHAQLARLVDEWWGERRPRLARIWFRHFGSLGVIAERDDGRVLGVALGAMGHDRAGVGVLIAVAVASSHRRHGLGRRLVEATLDRVRAAGATTVEATVWPGNRVGVRFLEGLGFVPDPESRESLYGVPAISDFDGEGEDRAVFVRAL